MTDGSLDGFSLEASLGAQLDELCDHFEVAWKAGETPRIEEFLARWPGEPQTLLAELLPLEIELRRWSSTSPSVDEYLARFPQQADLVRAALSAAETIDQKDDQAETANLNSVLGAASAPKQIGHFELIEQLGAGAFGVVWKARNTMLDRIAAIKIPRQSQLDAQGIEKFVREARAVAQLKHPNIVSIHEVGRDGEIVFIVSDYIAGNSLDQWLKGQTLSQTIAAELCRKIALALHHAHEAGVIHRDLKPSNVMIDIMGEPHVMDFGLAKRMTGEITMTVEGQILGTPAYMSPEQARGESHQADRRSDVYSLGVILYELLTGERPFRGSLQVILKQVMDDAPPALRKLDPNIKKDLQTICLKCLEKDPRRRYATAEQVAEELSRFLNNEPIQARPHGPLEQAWRWCRRSPAEAVLFSAIAFVIAQFLLLNLVLVPLLGGSAINSLIVFSDGVIKAGTLGAAFGGFIAIFACWRASTSPAFWPRRFIVGAIIGFIFLGCLAILSQEMFDWARNNWRNLKGDAIH